MRGNRKKCEDFYNSREKRDIHHSQALLLTSFSCIYEGRCQDGERADDMKYENRNERKNVIISSLKLCFDMDNRQTNYLECHSLHVNIMHR